MHEDDRDLNCWMHRDELRTAHDIQFQLLPHRCPQPAGFDIAAQSIPAQAVGGDYYNFHAVGGDYLGVVIADVSGKGLQAALIAAMLASTLRVQTWGNHDVCDTLSRVNDFILHALAPGMFITAIYGLLDIPHRTFSFARAGHEPLLLCRHDGSVRKHAPAGIALGLLSGSEFRQATEIEVLHLHSGDQILLYSDGLTEAMNTQGQEFGLPEIRQHAPCHLETTDRETTGSLDFITDIECQVREHTGDAPQHDDRTMLVISVL